MPCPKCRREDVVLTKHHIFPVRHFGRGSKNKNIFRLCRLCHDDLENLIPFEEQPRAFYRDIIETFLKEKGK